MMVVPVFTTSCHVSEKWKTGPVTPQTTMIKTAKMNARGWPAALDIDVATRVKKRSMAPETLTKRDGASPLA